MPAQNKWKEVTNGQPRLPDLFTKTKRWESGCEGRVTSLVLSEICIYCS